MQGSRAREVQPVNVENDVRIFPAQSDVNNYLSDSLARINCTFPGSRMPGIYQEFLDIFSQELGVAKKVFLKKMLATFMINYAESIFAFYANDILNESQMANFTADARDMFQLGFPDDMWASS